MNESRSAMASGICAVAPGFAVTSPMDYERMCMYTSDEGPMAVAAGGRTIVIKANDVCFVRPKVQHQLASKAGSEDISLYFDCSALTKAMGTMVCLCGLLTEFVLDSSAERQDVLVFSYEKGESVASLARAVIDEFGRMQASYDAAIISLVMRMMVVLARNYSCVHTREPGSGESRLFGDIMGFLSTNCAHVTLEETAKHFFYHPNTISAVLNRCSGKGFSEIVRDMRMEKAHILLKETNLPIAEVARLCGYGHMSHFYNLFKAQFKMTPGEYREKAFTSEHDITNADMISNAAVC